MKLTIEPGHIAWRYPNECNNRPIYAEISRNGDVSVYTSRDPSGNSMSEDVFNGRSHRIRLDVTSKKEIRAWYRYNRDEIKTIIAGMDTRYNGQNYVGTLTEEAKSALELVEYSAYDKKY